MAYTTIDDPSEYFHTQLYVGNETNRTITNDGNSDLQPDFIWVKNRTHAEDNNLVNTSVGVDKYQVSNSSADEASDTDRCTGVTSDGFSIGTDHRWNRSSGNYVAWQWKAGGSTPTKTYKVVVVSDSGNKYRFRNSGDTATYAASAVTLDLQEGGTYIFDQSDSSNSGHPLRFSTTSNGTHGGGSEYTTGVTTSGTAGNAGAFTQITVAASAPTLYYYCIYHSAMGGQVNTNSTHGQTNFDGSILSVVQTNTDAGFSILTYTANATAGATVGHGLGTTPSVVILKKRSGTGDGNWLVGHKAYVGNSAENLILDSTGAVASADDASGSTWNRTAFTSTVFTLGDGQAGDYTGRTNRTGYSMVAYCFSEVKGYSKMGFYTGSSNADGPFVYTGFKPAWLMIKNLEQGGGQWFIHDNKRETFNPSNSSLFAENSQVETANNSALDIDFLSNGFKKRNTGSGANNSGIKYIYMCFASSPFVSSKGVPTTAR